MTKQFSTPAYSTVQKIEIFLELFVVCSLIAIAILDGLANLSLNQDSTTYIEVASRLLQTGRMELLINNTDFKYTPTPRPYATQPPGFPLLLVPFVAVLHDPMVSIAMSQSLFIAFFYIAVYWMTVRFKLSPILRLVTLILMTFVAPLLMVHRRFSTETLFIAASIAAAAVALELIKDTGQKKDWILFCVLVASSSMLRYNGLANLIMIAPLFLRKDTIKAAGRLISHRAVHIGAIVAGVLLIALAFAIDVLMGGRPGIGHWQRLGIILGAAGVLAGVAGLLISKAGRMKKISNATYFQGWSEVDLWPLTAVLICTVPTLFWFARNRVLYGSVSPANGFLTVFRLDRLWDPVIYVWNDLLNVNSVLRPVLALLAILLLALPFLSSTTFGKSGLRKTSQIILVSLAMGHLALIWFLSLVTNIEPISERYFAPVLAFLLLGMVNGMQSAIELPGLQKWSTVLSAVPLVFLVLAGPFSPSRFIRSIGKVNYPAERQLWSEINEIEWTRTSSYFYSDYGYVAGGYIHQIFSDKPQAVIWNHRVLQDPDIVKQMLTGGVNPFILVTQTSYDSRMLDNLNTTGQLALGKIDFTDTGFVLYYLKR